MSNINVLTKKTEIKKDSAIIIPGDPSIDISEMFEIFSGLNIDAKKLRKEAWKRGHNRDAK